MPGLLLLLLLSSLLEGRFVRIWLRGFDIVTVVVFSLPTFVDWKQVVKKSFGVNRRFFARNPFNTRQVVSDVLAGGHPLGAGTDRQCAELWSSNPDFLWQVRYGGGGIP